MDLCSAHGRDHSRIQQLFRITGLRMPDEAIGEDDSEECCFDGCIESYSLEGSTDGDSGDHGGRSQGDLNDACRDVDDLSETLCFC